MSNNLHTQHLEETIAKLEAEAQALREEVAALKHSQQVLIGSRNAHRDERDAARTEVAALRARVVVPDGYALVPIELTRDMWVAVNKEDDKAYAGACAHGAQFDWLWQAAIDAAPRLNGKAVSEGLLLGLVQVIEKYTHDARVPNEVSQEQATELILAKRALLGEGKEHE